MFWLGSPICGLDEDTLISSLICAISLIDFLDDSSTISRNDFAIILAHFLLSFGAHGRFQTSV